MLRALLQPRQAITVICFFGKVRIPSEPHPPPGKSGLSNVHGRSTRSCRRGSSFDSVVVGTVDRVCCRRAVRAVSPAKGERIVAKLRTKSGTKPTRVASGGYARRFLARHGSGVVLTNQRRPRWSISRCNLAVLYLFLTGKSPGTHPFLADAPFYFIYFIFHGMDKEGKKHPTKHRKAMQKNKTAATAVFVVPPYE